MAALPTTDTATAALCVSRPAPRKELAEGLVPLLAAAQVGSASPWPMVAVVDIDAAAEATCCRADGAGLSSSPRPLLLPVPLAPPGLGLLWALLPPLLEGPAALALVAACIGRVAVTGGLPPVLR